MHVAKIQNADLIAHNKGVSRWGLILLLVVSCVLLWSLVGINWAKFSEGTGPPCFKIACLILNPIFKAMPILLWKIVIFSFGVLGVFASIKDLKNPTKMTLVLVMDETGVHTYRNSQPGEHLAWAEISKMSYWGDTLLLKPKISDHKNGSIIMTIKYWDVSKDDILGVIRKYRPDLHRPDWQRLIG